MRSGVFIFLSFNLGEMLSLPSPSPAIRAALFVRIKQYFEAYERELAREGKLPLGSTEKGFWGVSHLDDVYAFCERTLLDTKDGFLDLGSGDGRVVFVAALFTRAVGIEHDEKLHALALRARSELDIAVELICGDYTEHHLGGYDVLYTYADHNFRWLTPKLAELRPRATLYCYHDTFHPEDMVKGKTLWLGQLPVFRYTRRDAPRKE
jgi:SAM-dependent methyltransferase